MNDDLFGNVFSTYGTNCQINSNLEGYYNAGLGTAYGWNTAIPEDGLTQPLSAPNELHVLGVNGYCGDYGIDLSDEFKEEIERTARKLLRELQKVKLPNGPYPEVIEKYKIKHR